MDFVKLQELPRISASYSHSVDSRTFKTFKVRSSQETGGSSDVTALCFCPTSGSSELAVACGSLVQIFGVEFSSIEQRVNWSKHKNTVTCLAYRKDGKLLIAGDADGHANIYDVSVSKSIIRRLRGHDGKISSAAFVPDNIRVATAGDDQTVKIWDIPTGQVISSLRGHVDAVKCLVTVGETAIISAGADGRIVYWDLRSYSEVLSVSHGGPVERLAMFGSGALMFSVGGGIVRLWDVRTMTEVKDSVSSKHTKPVTSLVVSECGDFVASSSFDMTVKITRVSTWEVVASFTAPLPVTAMAWSGDALVSGFENGSWQLRQRRMGSVPQTVVTSDPSDSLARYYKTTTISSGPSKESTVNFMLRKFEYRKLWDFVVQSNPKTRLALAIVDELSQRGGLEAGLRNRPIVELTQAVDWCARNLTADSRCSMALVCQVLDVLVRTNSGAFASLQNEAGQKALLGAVKVLHNILGQETTIQLKALSALGLIEAVSC